MKTLRLHADYYTEPLWDIESADYVTPAELGLSANTEADLRDWQKEYDSLLDLENPREALAPAPDFNNRGQQIASQIQAEVGNRYRVQYIPR